MRNEEIYERLYLLYSVLQFCSQQKRMFTTAERIFINQERGRLLSALSDTETELKPVSDVIETKIYQTLSLMRIYNWVPLNKTDFND